MALLTAVVGLGLVACSPRTPATTGSTSGGTEHMGKVVPAPDKVTGAPHAPDLRSPTSAVRSYLAWTSFAYRIGYSDIATKTMGPEEEVRVDSYLQLNRQQNKRLDQTLKSIDARAVSQEGTRAIVAAHEAWVYHYTSDTDPPKSLTPEYTASYDTTYTLGKVGPTWVVKSVDAKPLGEVK